MSLRKSPSRRKSEAKGSHVSTRIYKRDDKEFSNIARGEFGGNESEAARVLISEALTTRRLRGAGLDQSLSAVKDAQKEVVTGELSDLKSGVAQVLSLLRSQATITEFTKLQTLRNNSMLILILASAFNIENITEQRLLRPAFESEGQSDEEAAASIAGEEKHWRSQAEEVWQRTKEFYDKADPF
jgi:hypothetical protein